MVLNAPLPRALVMAKSAHATMESCETGSVAAADWSRPPSSRKRGAISESMRPIERRAVFSGAEGSVWTESLHAAASQSAVALVVSQAFVPLP